MIRTFARFRRHVRPYRRLLAGGALLAVLDTVLGLAQPWPLKVVVDGVLAPGGPTVSSPKLVLGAAVAALVTIVGASALADYWSTRLMESAGQRIGNDIRDTLFAHLQRLSLGFHTRQSVGDLAARVTADVDRVQDLLVQSLAVLVPNALLVVGMLAVMLAVDPVFTALALLSAPVMVFAIARTTREMKEAARRARKVDGRVAAATTEKLGAIQLVQAFSLERVTEHEFRQLNEASLEASLEAVRHQARLSPVVDLSGVAATAVLLWFGALRVLDGRMTLGVLLVFISYVGALYKPIKALAKLGYVTSRGTACGERIAAVLAEAPEVADRVGAYAAPRFTGTITFDDVRFSYGREPVLDGVDLEIAAGEVVAIVGPTGAGKSTLVSLVPRFFDPTGGAVLVDGHDVRDLTLSTLRAQVGLVLQDSVLFRASLADNIACARPGATDREVGLAARLALVDEFAGRLPDGLGTVVGERGADLSGGQRQRVAIARAILRDAPILILDEPTSALDAESESLVMEALGNLVRDRTVLVVAHRLATVRRADRVVVLEAGGVAEVGTHDELLAGAGPYSRLCRLQGLTVESPRPQPAPVLSLLDEIASRRARSMAARRRSGAW